MNRRRSSGIPRVLKDYLVPIVILVIIVGVIMIYMSGSKGDGAQDMTPISDLPSIHVSYTDADTEAYIQYEKGRQNKINLEADIYPSEKVELTNNTLNISSTDFNFKLNELGQFKYEKDGSYSLIASDLWGSTSGSVEMNMTYLKLNIMPNTIFALHQNEVASIVYVLNGQINATNLVGNNVSISKNQELSIMKDSSKDSNSDLSTKLQPIGDYYKSTSWFINNGGTQILEEQTKTQVDSTDDIDDNKPSTNIQSAYNQYIIFDMIYDEAEVETNSINITGDIIDDRVYTIAINNKNATVDLENAKFEVDNISTASKVNDIIYKIYDEDSVLLYKGIITLYNKNGTGNTINQTTQTPDTTTVNTQINNEQNLSNIPLNNSDTYKIAFPGTNPYTTSESLVTLEGYVPAGVVKRITVNDYQLQQFPQYTTYWRYNANSEFGNLDEGVNIYNIRYFSANDEILYESNFVIIKN